FVPWSDIPDVTAALDFMEPANAGLVIDCWHVFRGTTTLAQLAALPSDRILCIQVNDAGPPRGSLPDDTRHRLFCGEGEFDLLAFVKALRRTGTTVPLSVEIISPEVAAMPLDEVTRWSFATAAPLSDLGKSARLVAGGKGALVRSNDAGHMRFQHEGRNENVQ